MISIESAPKLEGVEYYIGNENSKILYDFYDRFKDNKNISNLDYFFHNIRTLKLVKATKGEMTSPSSLAEYSVEFNFIRYIPDEFLVAISHELCHLASSIRTDDCQFSGFSQFQKKGKILIGVGINEGYSCLLDERYFKEYVAGKSEYLKDTYMVVKQIAGMLETLIGQEKMENWYFTADLKSLVDYLCQFMDYDEVICFLLAVDNIFFYCDEGKVIKPRIAIENYKYVVEFIGRCYINIFSQLLFSNEISQEKYDELMTYVYSIMSQELKFKRFTIFKSRKMSLRTFNKIVAYEQDKTLKKYI